MLKLCETFVAALKFALPACDAVIVQEPAARIRTVPGAGVVTRQLLFALLALKLTGKPDEAVGFTMKSGSPKVLFARAPNVNPTASSGRSEEHTSELQSPCNLVCRLLLEKKKKNIIHIR